MKFTINSTDLSKAIDQVIKFVPNKPVHPILANVKLTAISDDSVLLTAFDLSNGIQLELKTDVINAGEICVPAQLFNAIIKGTPGYLIIEVVDTLMTVSNLSGSCEIQCQHSDEYPSIIPDDIDKTIQCEIDIKTFAQAIKLGGSCASDETSKAILQGVNIVAENGLLTLASTNGHKLVVYKTAIDESIKIPSSTIPTKSLGTIEGCGMMTLTISDTDCMVNTGDTIITCRSFAGKYPDYPRLLPNSFSRVAVLDRTQLIDSLNLMNSIGSENSLVKFVFENNELIISSAKEGVRGERLIECEMTGDSFENYEELEGQLFVLSFNLKYLLGQLKTIPGQRVQFSMNSNDEPVTIKPVESDLDLLCLVMPVVVRN